MCMTLESQWVGLYSLTHSLQLGRFRSTCNFVCIKRASIQNSHSRDLKHGRNFSKHCEVIVLTMKSLTRLKGQVKSLEYKTFTDEIDFHKTVEWQIPESRLFFFSGVLHGKWADVPAKNVRCRSGVY